MVENAHEIGNSYVGSALMVYIGILFGNLILKMLRLGEKMRGFFRFLSWFLSPAKY